MLLVKNLVNRIEEFQQNNTMMFTRIMDKLAGSSLAETSDSCAAFQIRDFPCASLDKFEKLNDLCSNDQDVQKTVVISFDYFL